jgi:hypothetical protein
VCPRGWIGLAIYSHPVSVSAPVALVSYEQRYRRSFLFGALYGWIRGGIPVKREEVELVEVCTLISIYAGWMPRQIKTVAIAESGESTADREEAKVFV